jgi:hypothetical protein
MDGYLDPGGCSGIDLHCLFKGFAVSQDRTWSGQGSHLVARHTTWDQSVVLSIKVRKGRRAG